MKQLVALLLLEAVFPFIQVEVMSRDELEREQREAGQNEEIREMENGKDKENLKEVISTSMGKTCSGESISGKETKAPLNHHIIDMSLDGTKKEKCVNIPTCFMFVQRPVACEQKKNLGSNGSDDTESDVRPLQEHELFYIALKTLFLIAMIGYMGLFIKWVFIK